MATQPDGNLVFLCSHETLNHNLLHCPMLIEPMSFLTGNNLSHHEYFSSLLAPILTHSAMFPPPPMVESIRPKLEQAWSNLGDAQAVSKCGIVPWMYYILRCRSGLGPLFPHGEWLSICRGKVRTRCFTQKGAYIPHGRG